MDTETRLADILFTRDPMQSLNTQTDLNFQRTDRVQFGLFYARLINRIEDRLSQQFGACLGLIEEQLGLDSKEFAKMFTISPEYRVVREDLIHEEQTSPSRFEIAFLDFVLRTQNQNTNFIDEFSAIYLQELAIKN